MQCWTGRSVCALTPSTSIYEMEFFPSLNLDMTIVANRDVSQKSKLDGKQCRSWWDGSLWAVSSGSTLFAQVSGLLFWDEKVKCLSTWKRSKHRIQANLIARTPMARLSWLIRTRFGVPTKFSNRLRKQIFRKIFIFYHEIVCLVYSLESPHRGDSNEYTQHSIIM